jgi:hypothetical protein
VFRRRTEDPTSPDERAAREPEVAGRPAGPSGKGRPTPKRREAERARRRPIGAVPGDRKAAREEMRRQRAEQRAAMERGDESRMPARDRGPVRRFARDYVDVRRTVAEYFLPIGVLLYVVLIIARSTAVKSVVSIALFALILLIVFEMTRLGIGLSRALRERFTDQERRGAVLYGLTRAGQVRRLRLPKPMVKPGEQPRR